MRYEVINRIQIDAGGSGCAQPGGKQLTTLLTNRGVLVMELEWPARNRPTIRAPRLERKSRLQVSTRISEEGRAQLWRVGLFGRAQYTCTSAVTHLQSIDQLPGVLCGAQRIKVGGAGLGTHDSNRAAPGRTQ